MPDLERVRDFTFTHTNINADTIYDLPQEISKLTGKTCC